MTRFHLFIRMCMVVFSSFPELFNFSLFQIYCRRNYIQCSMKCLCLYWYIIVEYGEMLSTNRFECSMTLSNVNTCRLHDMTTRIVCEWGTQFHQKYIIEQIKHGICCGLTVFALKMRWNLLSRSLHQCDDWIWRERSIKSFIGVK